MITTLAIANYRSIRSLVLPLTRLNVVTGPNGSGKSSLYRALRLLAETAQGNLVGTLAREGGLQSTLWAGPEQVGRAVKRGTYAVEGTVRQGVTQLRLGFGGDDFSYAVDLGLPAPPDDAEATAFSLDPQIKRECIWSGAVFRQSSLLVDRRGPALRARSEAGSWEIVAPHLSLYESMMGAFADPRGAPEMILLRERVRSWRFYDHFRTDAQAPARQAQIGTYTPVLGHDGADLAAALQTIEEIGDAKALSEAIEDAFPRAKIAISVTAGRFELGMRQHGLLRPLAATELSDGTLRFLLLVAALLSPRPPELLVLNEPETSLHPDLVPALARLISKAAARTQIVVVSHNSSLIETLIGERGASLVALQKDFGETVVAGQGLLDRPPWTWPDR